MTMTTKPPPVGPGAPPPDGAQLTLALTEEEAHDLRRCEQVIEEGRRQFLAVGNALMQIQERRLYRQTHATFEAYLKERWDMSASHGYRQINTYQMAAGISPIGDANALPTNEAQFRELGRLPATERQEAWAEVVAAAADPDKITAADIKAVVDRMLGLEVAAMPIPESADSMLPPAITSVPDDHRDAETPGFFVAPPSAPAATAQAPSVDVPMADASQSIAVGKATPPAPPVPAPAAPKSAAPAAPAAAPITPTPEQAARMTPPPTAMTICPLPADEADWLMAHYPSGGLAIARLRELEQAEADREVADFEGDVFTARFSSDRWGRLRLVAEQRSAPIMNVLNDLIDSAYDALTEDVRGDRTQVCEEVKAQ